MVVRVIRDSMLVPDLKLESFVARQKGASVCTSVGLI